ncbi:xylulokinase [Opitutus terrae]|uniref:Xylulose kinase n=1 Tax=Opitutus terrae (strain DSM 11246 / JCM 15787 / PB90-1) TaxID=452637 RepID=B1ZW84_OPITP|nr:xylulokinase [Opitutus terrae]ACB76836.1 xylulokinase [Opitutus terrae PB90-1]
MSLFIGIDSGTQSVKAIVLDLETRKVVAEARAPHQLIEGLPVGHMEQHPEDWTSALDFVIGEVVAKIGAEQAKRVRGIGVSGQQHGFVPLDENGAVIRPAKLWCDTSTAPECAIITKKLGGPKAAIRKTGNLILPGFTAPKILWLKRHEPENYKKLRHVLLPHDYLNFHLTGNYFMEFGDASGTAMMDVRTRKWSKDVIAAIDRKLADYLPPISESHQAAGTLRAELAAKYGLSTDVVVSAGGGDNMMGAIGTGNVAPGVVTASFGTSGTIYAFASKPVIDPQGEIAAFCSSTGGWLPLLCTMNVTTVTEQIRTLFGLDVRALDDSAAKAPAGANGLILLPYLAGERTPNVPDGSGVFFGLNQKTFNAAHLNRAAMEGVTMGMNYGLRRLATLGVKAKEIRVTGGGSKSPFWRQMMADIFGVPVVGMVEDEGAALGGALQAAWCVAIRDGNKKAKLTDFTTGTVALDESTRCTPNKANVARYRELQALQDKLSLALREVFADQRALANKA